MKTRIISFIPLGITVLLMGVVWWVYSLGYAEVTIEAVDMDHQTVEIHVVHTYKNITTYVGPITVIPICDIKAVKKAETAKAQETAKALRAACK